MVSIERVLTHTREHHLKGLEIILQRPMILDYETKAKTKEATTTCQLFPKRKKTNVGKD